MHAKLRAAEVRVPTGGDAAQVTADGATLDHIEGDPATVVKLMDAGAASHDICAWSSCRTAVTVGGKRMRIREHWPVARSRLRRRGFATVFDRVAPGSVGDMLEVGSGDGLLASLLAPLGRSLTTTEYASGEASHGRELPRLRCSVTELPFADAAFDFIF